MSAAPDRRPPAWRRWVLAGLACLCWALVYVPPTSLVRSQGWDEAMHADLPAARLALALEGAEGAETPGAWFSVLSGCQQYPFLHPLLLSGAYAAFGLDEGVGRRTGRAMQGLGLLALFGLTATLARRLEETRGRPWPGSRLAPWLALLAGTLSPLWLAYSGTFFLEAPSATLWALCLWAWVARGARRGLPQAALDLFAGALLAAALFTKFNYGLLLGLGLTLDHASAGISAWRGRRIGQFLRGSSLLALPPLAAALWWFLWPWPGDGALGAEHRQALLGFLSGNREVPYTPLARRVWDLSTFLAPGPGALALALVGVLAALPGTLRAGPRALWLVALVCAAVLLRHPFHLDRFLLPAALPWMPLAALGLARLCGAGAGLRPAARLRPGLLVALLLAALHWRAPLADRTAALLGLLRPGDASAASYVAGLHRERLSLAPARLLPTAGLERAAFDGFLDAIAAELAPEERVAFLEINSELSPAALHLGLLARGGSPARLFHDAARVRSDGQPEMVVTFEAADPGWISDQVRAWARGFDVVLSTEPIDWKGRRGREFLGRYRSALFETGEWSYRELATIEVARPNQAPTRVQLFALRRAPR